MEVDFREYIKTVALVCFNCGWSGPSEDALPISDYALRVAPGEVTPAAECPDCHALVYIDAKHPDAETNPDQVLINAGTKMLSALQGVAYMLRQEVLNRLAGEPWALKVGEAIAAGEGKTWPGDEA